MINFKIRFIHLILRVNEYVVLNRLTFTVINKKMFNFPENFVTI